MEFSTRPAVQKRSWEFYAARYGFKLARNDFLGGFQSYGYYSTRPWTMAG